MREWDNGPEPDNTGKLMWFLLAEYHVTPAEFGELTFPQITCLLDKGEHPAASSSSSTLTPAAIRKRLAEFYGPDHRFAPQRERR